MSTTPAPTAPWPWPRRDRITGRVHFTPGLRRDIAALTVAWNPGESGAAALASPGFDLLVDLADRDGESLKLPLDLFFARASLEPFAGTIRNPFAVVHDMEAAPCVDCIPDRGVVALLKSGQDIPFDASAEDLALWKAASIDWRGVDPKRPFGSTNVPRDLRALIDPDKKLSSAAFAKRRKAAESRLVLMLLLFVQAAQLTPGDYERDHNCAWHPAGSISTEPERIAEHAWCDRIAHELYDKCDDAVRTLAALRHLVQDGRLAGGYATLADRFRLHEIFERDWHAVYEGHPAERLESALRHFPERSGIAAKSFFTLMLVRVRNSGGAFEASVEALTAAGLEASQAPQTSEISLGALAVFESLIAQRGNGTLDQAAFAQAIEESHGDGPGWCVREWARQLVDADAPDGADAYVWRLMQCAAAQILLMSASAL